MVWYLQLGKNDHISLTGDSISKLDHTTYGKLKNRRAHHRFSMNGSLNLEPCLFICSIKKFVHLFFVCLWLGRAGLSLWVFSITHDIIGIYNKGAVGSWRVFTRETESGLGCSKSDVVDHDRFTQSQPRVNPHRIPTLYKMLIVGYPFSHNFSRERFF